MAVSKWPPDWWTAIVNGLGPYNQKFLDGLIPLMDVRQFIYTFLREMVDWIPHQPPTHMRPVQGQINAAFSGGAKVFIPLGEVGYDVIAREVLWNVNKNASGSRPFNMRLPTPSVMPVVFQLLMMIPWSFVGEAEAAIGDAIGSDTPPKAADIVGWLYGNMRTSLAEAGINLPAIPGNYSSQGASIVDITIPPGTYVVSNGVMQYTATLSSAMVVRARDMPNVQAQVIHNVTGISTGIDAMLNAGAEVTMILPDLVTNRDYLRCTIAPRPVQGTLNTRPSMSIVLINTRDQAASVVPSLGDLLLYNIPVINFCQNVYRAAVELVEAIPHHTPIFRRNVWVNGVSVRFFYRIIDSAGNMTEYQDLPDPHLVEGNTFVVLAQYSDNIRVIDTEVLLSKSFEATEFSVDFVATEAGWDGFFDGYDNFSLDPAARQADALAFRVEVNEVRDELTELRAEAADLQQQVNAALAADSAADVSDLLLQLAEKQVEVEETTLLLSQYEQRLNDLLGLAAQGSFRPPLITPPPELTRGFSTTVIGFEQGLDEVIAEDGTVFPATFARFRLRVSVIQEAGAPSNPFNVGGVSPYQTEHVVDTPNALIAVSSGLMVTSLDPEAIYAEVIPNESVYSDWRLSLTQVLSVGAGADENADPGASFGQPARVRMTLSYAGAAAVTLDDPLFFIDENGNDRTMTFLLAGTSWTINLMQQRNALIGRTFRPPTSFTYEGTPVEDSPSSVTRLRLSRLDVTFAASLGDGQTFLRWLSADDLEYIGAELDLSNPFTSSKPIGGIQRFVHARLAYKTWTDDVHYETGEPLETKNWTLEYTKDPKRAPDGIYKAVTIEYNATTRIVTVRNNRDGSFVEMTLNATIWFMLQLMLMIPVEMF
jgi:hypothetical protein